MMKEHINNISFLYIYLDLLAQNITFFYIKTQAFFTCPRVEEGEEKHPPVGKDINRPKFPNNSPPCRYTLSTRVVRGDLL